MLDCRKDTVSIRDPLYGLFDLSDTEVSLINTEAFLRLLGIKQLSYTYLVYPSAVHTRYGHSLGSMHVAGLICEKIGLDPEQTRLVRLAALLHDIGHGPFSHLFENVLKPINPIDGSVHESITRKMILDDPEIKTILGNDKHIVAEILNDNKTLVRKDRRLMSDIVSSNLDADKLDYLARDSYFLGVSYGKFDLARILHTVCPTLNNERLGVHFKGLHALENYRLARHLLTVQAYQHHTRLAADQMFLSALRLAIDKERIIPKDKLKISSRQFLRFYKKLDDCSIVNIIVSDKRSKTSRKILGDIRARRLLKRVYEVQPVLIKDPSTRRALLYKKDKLTNIAEDIKKQLRLPDHKLIVHESKTPIKLYDEEDIPCVDNDGNVSYVQALSPIRADSGIMAYYVFGPESMRKIIHDKFVAADIGA